MLSSITPTLELVLALALVLVLALILPLLLAPVPALALALPQVLTGGEDSITFTLRSYITDMKAIRVTVAHGIDYCGGGL